MPATITRHHIAHVKVKGATIHYRVVVTASGRGDHSIAHMTKLPIKKEKTTLWIKFVALNIRRRNTKARNV